MFKQLTIPTILTWGRVFLIPVFVLVYYLPDTFISMFHRNILGFTIFILAAITDYLDGFLARRLGQESRFGAFLDPVADKAIVASSLVILVALHRTFIFAAIVIILREIAISALREWMAEIGQNKHVAVAYIGKVKTMLQFVAIALLLLDWNTNLVGNIFMLLAVVFTVVSMFYYLEQAKKCF